MKMFKQITLDVTLLNGKFYKGEAELVYNMESIHPVYSWRKLDSDLWIFFKSFVESDYEIYGHSEDIDGDYMTSVTVWTLPEDND